MSRPPDAHGCQRWSGAALAVLAVVLGCEVAPAAGRFEVTFTWEAEPTRPVFVWARVEERVVPDEPGRRLAETGPVAYTRGEGVRLALGDVPHGDDRVVVVEVRDGESPLLPAFAFGVSAPFALWPGTDVEVPVHLALRPVDRGDTEGRVTLRLAGAPDGAPAPSRATLGDLRALTAVTRSVGARRMLVANDPSLSAHVREVDLTAADAPCVTSDSDPAVTVCTLTGWDLTDGVATFDGASLSVFVRFVDRHGYSLPMARASVILDVTPVSVVPGTASVQLVPDASSPLREVRAATNGTTVRTTFTLSEPLLADRDSDGAPLPRVVLRDASFVLAQVAHVGTLYTYEGVLEGVPEGQEYTERIEIAVAPEPLLDEAGNAAPAALWIGDVAVDTRPPQPPGVTAAVGTAPIVYTRAPWGSTATEGLPTFCVHGTAGAVEPHATVVVYDGPHPASAAEVGRGTADGSGAFGARLCRPRAQAAADGPQPLELSRADRERVFVAAVDAAGNARLAAVRDVTWVATLGGKVAGSERENPHAFDAWDTWSGPRLPGRGREVGAPPHGIAAPLAWTRYEAGQVVAPSDVWAAVYDSRRGRTVALAGCDAPDGGAAASEWPASCVWEWDGAVWVRRVPDDPEGDGTPVARHGAGAVYDSLRGRVVLFGGWSDDCAEGGEGVCGLVWEWDGASWARRMPVDADGSGAPSAEWGSTMAYDAQRGRVVLVQSGESEACGAGEARACPGTWEWDGRRWARREPTDPEGDGDPSACRSGLATYDGVRGRVVLYEGWCSGLVWEWDGTSWARRDPLGVEGDPAPTLRYSAAMVHDGAARAVVLFGGFVDQGCGEGSVSICGATWRWADGRWARLTPVDPEGDGDPPARYQHAMVYDALRRRTVLFGGQCAAGDFGEAPCGDVWEWDGASWARRYPHGLSGAHHRGLGRGVTVAYDAARRAVVAEGCESSDAHESACASATWLWDGAEWRRSVRIDPEADGAPLPRVGGAMTYDATHRQVLLYGGTQSLGCEEGTGYLCGALWAWSGASWARLAPTGSAEAPLARTAAALAHDTARHRTVLFGGRTGAAFGDTWEWDGAGWMRCYATDPEGDGQPAARSGAAMVYDAVRHRVVLFGGRADADCEEGVGPYCVDVWEWDGASWARVQPPGAAEAAWPAPREGHAMVYDRPLARVVLFGGRNGTDCGEAAGPDCRDAWAFDGARWTRYPAPADGVGGWPAARASLGLACDESRRRLVLTGGSASRDCGEGAAEVCVDTWEAAASPSVGHVFRVRLRSAVPSGPTPEVRSLTARWWAGGRVLARDGRESLGAQLAVWDPTSDAWREVADEEAAPEAPEVVEWTSSDAAFLAGLPFGERLELGVAVHTVPSVGGAASIATRDVEVTVRYRLAE